MQVIDVMATVRAAFGTVNRNLPTLFALAAVPLALNLLLLLVDQALPGDGNVASNLLVYLLSGAINVPFLTAWHRLALLGRDRARGVLGYRFRPAEVRFLGFAMLFYCLIYVAMIVVPIMMVTVAAGGGFLLLLTFFLAAGVVLAFPLLKLSLVLPAAAFGRPMTLVQSWHVTANNGWAMVFVMAFVFLPILLIATAIQGSLLLAAAVLVAENGDPATGAALLGVLMLLLLALSYYFTAAFVSALSLMFRQLTGYDPASFKPEDVTRR